MRRNKVMDNLYGLMEDAIKDYGRMVSKMVKEFIVIKMGFKELVFGQMERR
jgi:hypothetical protein